MDLRGEIHYILQPFIDCVSFLRKIITRCIEWFDQFNEFSEGREYTQEFHGAQFDMPSWSEENLNDAIQHEVHRMYQTEQRIKQYRDFILEILHQDDSDDEAAYQGIPIFEKMTRSAVSKLNNSECVDEDVVANQSEATNYMSNASLMAIEDDLDFYKYEEGYNGEDPKELIPVESEEFMQADQTERPYDMRRCREDEQFEDEQVEDDEDDDDEYV